MRTKRAFLNVFSALLFQLVTIVCGFVLPRAIIGTFGSDTNGVIQSATQFLGYITLLEAGVGGVTRASLYKPLANGNYSLISSILKATELFFRKIAYIFIAYVILLTIVFPYIANSSNNHIYISTLVLVISVSTFVQYYYGITYSVFLQADQKTYVPNVISLLTVIFNTVLSLILIKMNFGIHIVKLGTAIVFILRPILLNLYVKKHYPINLHCNPNNEAIDQRWDGLGHHIAFYLHTNTDIVLITIFMNVMEVSVYSVYNMVIIGVRNLTTVVSSGLEAGFGNIIAKKEEKTLNEVFRSFETLVSIVAISLFMSAAFLYTPFISLYTNGVNDVDYIRPIIGYLMVAAEMIYCFRIPYNSVTLAAGHYKQTRNGAFLEAGINIVISLLLIKPLGIAGVVIGTLIAMIIRTIQYAVYISKFILHRKQSVFIIRFLVNGIIVSILIVLLQILPRFNDVDYYHFLLDGIYVFLICFLFSTCINALFYPKDIKYLLDKLTFRKR